MSKAQIKTDIAAAKPAKPATAASGAGSAPPPPPPGYLTSRFHVEVDGVWMDRPEGKARLWICGKLEPIAQTQDEDNFFGVLWRWQDPNGVTCEEVFSRASMTGEAGEMCKAMAARGLKLNASQEARKAFVEYVNFGTASGKARVVSRTGWHCIEGKRIYVLPGQNFGKSPVTVILQSQSREGNIFQTSGTLAEWREAIGHKCVNNSRLGLAVCMAFAAPLLDLAGEDGGGINLFGDSRSGKTTCGIMSASVYGGDQYGGGARGAVRTWRSTSNSTEAIAALHSDVGLVMDELGQADSRDVGAAAYMLAGGQGKTRLDRGIGLRATLRFRIFYLSTAELTLSAKMAEAGTKVKAGQGVRMVDLPADEDAGMGAFRDLHGADSAGQFAQELRDSAAKFYGTPLRAFIAYIIDRIERDPEFTDFVKAEIERIIGEWLAPLGTHSGQVRSVARRFGLIALAGNLATDAMITGWGQVADTGERQAQWMARTCFMAWLNERGTVGTHEDAQAVLQLRKFIAENKSSRFEDWKPPPESQQEPDEVAPPVEKFRTMKSVGWRKFVAGEYLYLLTTTGIHEALEGLNFKAALKVLVARGLILPRSPKETATTLRVPGAGPQKLYQVPSAVISAEPDTLPAAKD